VPCDPLWAGRQEFFPERGKSFLFATKFTALVPMQLYMHWISLKELLGISILSYTTRLRYGRVRTPRAENNYRHLSIIVFTSLLESMNVIGIILFPATVKNGVI
jgi:hypothetical protein